MDTLWAASSISIALFGSRIFSAAMSRARVSSRCYTENNGEAERHLHGDPLGSIIHVHSPLWAQGLQCCSELFISFQHVGEPLPAQHTLC